MDFGLHHIGVVLILTVFPLDHHHKPGGHQGADLPPLVDGASDALLLPIGTGVVEIGQRTVFRDLFPLGLQNAAHQAVNHVIAADDCGALRQTLEKAVNRAGKALVVGLMGDAPFDVVVLKLHAALQHGGHRPLKLFDALIVVVDENTRDPAVPGLNQQTDQLIGAGGIIDNNLGIPEIFIVIGALAQIGFQIIQGIDAQIGVCGERKNRGVQILHKDEVVFCCKLHL